MSSKRIDSSNSMKWEHEEEGKHDEHEKQKEEEENKKEGLEGGKEAREGRGNTRRKEQCKKEARKKK